MKHLILLLSTFLLQSLTSAAQTVPFPLHPAGRAAVIDGLLLTPDLAEVAGLLGHQSVRMDRVPMSDGSYVSLELERLSIERHKFGLHVNGLPAPGVVEALGISVWKGTVLGHPDSDVMLAFAPYGCRGWIKVSGELTHLMPQPDNTGDWGAGSCILATETALIAQGLTPQFECAAVPPPGPNSSTIQPLGTTVIPPLESGGTCYIQTATVAIECDDQFFALFNNLNAATTYVVSLWTFIGDRFATQVNTILTHPYLNIPTLGNDPWTTQDTGGTSLDLLIEFQAAWAGNIPNDCTTGHFMSGAILTGGVAWLNGICGGNYNFAVSGNLFAGVQFPVTQRPLNWDFFVCAHELGHNFGSPHTHEFCPPLDECAPSPFFGQCHTQQVCSNQGTLMSYCFYCPGRTNNITTYFHTVTANTMRQEALCLDFYASVTADSPQLLIPGVPTPVTLTTNLAPSSPPTLYFDATGNGYQPISMTSSGPDTWTADLPPSSCGDSATYYYSLDDPTCGGVTVPGTAPWVVYTAHTGYPAPLVSDDLEVPTGWTVGTSTDDATEGIWELVDPEGTLAQPGNDHTALGTQCWVTGQGIPGGSPNANDVDGGSTTLLSPIYDLSAVSAARVSYWHWLSNDSGPYPYQDTLQVKISNNGGATWSFLETIGPSENASGGWEQSTIYLSGLLALTSQMQLAFIASDFANDSTVEAAIDDILIESLECTTVVGTNYCTPAVVNSTGQSASIAGVGTIFALDNSLVLTVSDLPNGQPSYFLASQSQAHIPGPGGSSGVLCLGAPTARFAGNVLIATAGEVSLSLNLTQVPLPPTFAHAISPGESWNFQLWFRDSNPTNTSNFSDGLTVNFQ
jgi:hypothetical protein